MGTWTNLFFNFVYGSVVVGMGLLAVRTLLPAAAEKVNRLGYYSTCSFAPWSTLSLLAIALVLVGIIAGVQRLVLN
jgi:predicted membrane metal-binding protein